MAPSGSACLSPSPRWALLPHPAGAPAEPIARQWLGAALGRAGDALPIGRDARGRPRFGGEFAHLDCSWSHSGGHLLVALGDGVRVGADLERLGPHRRALDLARRFFTAAETGWLEGLDAASRERAFARLWCMKEAVLKAHGHGLSFGLHRLRFVERDGRLELVETDPALGAAGGWDLREFEPVPGYAAALAWHPRAPAAASQPAY